MSLTILQRIARGDRDAVPACIETYGSLILSLARRHASDLTDAEDATQEIFIDLWRHASRFNPSVGSEATFVAVIARRRLLDRSRKRGRSIPTTSLPEDGSPHYIPDPDRLVPPDDVAYIRARMAEISPEQRTVLEMSIDRGMSQSEIATALGLPLGTVKAHARRGLIRLRELVSRRAEESLREGDVR